jgi:hypothetical protein
MEVGSLKILCPGIVFPRPPPVLPLKGGGNYVWAYPGPDAVFNGLKYDAQRVSKQKPDYKVIQNQTLESLNH